MTGFRLRSALAWALVLGMGCAVDPHVEREAAALTAVGSFGANPGALTMGIHVPTPAPSGPAPLVVVMHGCTQGPADIERTGWNELADALGFYVIYPGQSSSNNPAGCFNWAGEYGDEANLRRGEGENQSVISMVDHMKATYTIDDARVFAVGFSAGGAMVPVLLATWPDVFAGGAINAGIPYRCATSVGDAFTCQGSGRDLSPSAWGDLVRAAGPSSYAGPFPRVSIWQGSSDTTVTPANSTELIDQWTDVNGIDQRADVSATVDGAAYEGFTDASGTVLVERYTISGMGHAVARGSSTFGSCGASGSYISDEGICSSYRQALFFGLDRSDSNPPTVTISAPSMGARVNGNTIVRAMATDDEALARAELRVDGVLRGEQTLSGTSRSLMFTWDASAELDGERRVDVVVFDDAGNSTTATVNVTVEGGMADTVAPVVSANPRGQVFAAASITVVLSANEPATIYFTRDGSAPTMGSTEYTGAIAITNTTTLRFFGVDAAGNASAAVSETYTRLTYDEVVSGTCTEHLVAMRLNNAGYLDCGMRFGYIASVDLYRFGDCYSYDESGTGCDVGPPPPPAPVCGDGICNGTETRASCATDCPPECGDLLCEAGENTVSCPNDCPPECGDGNCDPGETMASCAMDCTAPAECGDGRCEGDETRATCAADCGPMCGDGVCEGSETSSCASDCGPVCGDGVCDIHEVGSCARDCGEPGTCEDGTCDPGESFSCPTDCPMGPLCGDGVCEAIEVGTTCIADCDALEMMMPTTRDSGCAAAGRGASPFWLLLGLLGLRRRRV